MIQAETYCHIVTLNKINIHNTSCVLTCESLLPNRICLHGLHTNNLTFTSDIKQTVCNALNSSCTPLPSSKGDHVDLTQPR
jgi:hypothetical protein